MKKLFFIALVIACNALVNADELKIKHIGECDNFYPVFYISYDSIQSLELNEFNIVISKESYDYLIEKFASYSNYYFTKEELLSTGSYKVERIINGEVISSIKLNPELSTEFLVELLCVIKDSEVGNTEFKFFKENLKKNL
jgi:hypothetical protein